VKNVKLSFWKKARDLAEKLLLETAKEVLKKWLIKK